MMTARTRSAIGARCTGEAMQWPILSIAYRMLLTDIMLPGNSGSADRYCSRLPWLRLCRVGVACTPDDCCDRAGPDQYRRGAGCLPRHGKGSLQPAYRRHSVTPLGVDVRSSSAGTSATKRAGLQQRLDKVPAALAVARVRDRQHDGVGRLQLLERRQRRAVFLAAAGRRRPPDRAAAR